MAYTIPQVQDFKNLFYRDFSYGTDPTTSILDQDIQTAFAYAVMTINQGVWPDQVTFTQAFLLLAAHRMVLNLRAGSQGLNGQYNFAQNQKSVGAVSESFEIPERIKNNPSFMMLTKTNYGAQYLELALPYLTGQIFTVAGFAKP